MALLALLIVGCTVTCVLLLDEQRTNDQLELAVLSTLGGALAGAATALVAGSQQFALTGSPATPVSPGWVAVTFTLPVLTGAISGAATFAAVSAGLVDFLIGAGDAPGYSPAAGLFLGFVAGAVGLRWTRTWPVVVERAS